MGSGNTAGRLFLAAPLSDEIRTALADHLDTALSGRALPGRRVPPRNWHLTLRFLGDCTIDARDKVVAALGEGSPGAQFSLGLGGLGAFPRPDRARVLWIGTTDGTPLLRLLAEKAEAAARAGGFEPERRPFSSHLTLSRLRPEEDVTALIASVPPFGKADVIREIVLYRSHLGPQGARYEAVHRFPLDSAVGQESHTS
jgi:2'-5' RNA ligase